VQFNIYLHCNTSTQRTQEKATGDDDLQNIVRSEMSESAGPSAEIWQQSACAWDRKQIRSNQFRPYDVQRNGEKPLDM
jgi:hypothetical protein